jgi:hypothetical protein
MKLERLVSLDRRIIYLLIAVGTLVPILWRIGLPVSPTPPVQALFARLETLGPDNVVLASFDYGPTTGPEITPMARAILRHCFERRIKVVAIALFPLGGVTMGGEVLGEMAAEYPTLRDGEDYIYLGYKDGTQAAMKLMGASFASVFPFSNAGVPVEEIPLMQQVRNYADIDLVVSFSTNVIGEWWANLVNAQFRVPVAVGTTAVWAPKHFAFLDSGQILGLLGGLKGASEYEHLLVAAYPRLEPLYERAGVYTAMKGMDAQTVDHAIIMLLILIGNAAYFWMRRRERARRLG